MWTFTNRDKNTAKTSTEQFYLFMLKYKRYKRQMYSNFIIIWNEFYWVGPFYMLIDILINKTGFFIRRE